MTSTNSSAVFDAFADIYDRIDLDRSVELSFYADLLPQGTNPAVLELGCGTGTILIGMAAKHAKHPGNGPGYWVGLDESKPMLDIAKQRAPQMHWWVGDMRQPPSSQQFDWVVCCFHTLQLLLCDEDVLSMFDSVRRLLKPDGKFVFDIYQPQLSFLRQPHPVNTVRRFKSPDNIPCVVQEESWFDDVRHILTTRWWVCDEHGKTIEPVREMWVKMRQYFQHDLEVLLHRAGLKIESCYGHYDKRPLTPAGPKQIYICGLVGDNTQPTGGGL